MCFGFRPSSVSSIYFKTRPRAVIPLDSGLLGSSQLECLAKFGFFFFFFESLLGIKIIFSTHITTNKVKLRCLIHAKNWEIILTSTTNCRCPITRFLSTPANPKHQIVQWSGSLLQGDYSNTQCNPDVDSLTGIGLMTDILQKNYMKVMHSRTSSNIMRSWLVESSWDYHTKYNCKKTKIQ